MRSTVRALAGPMLLTVAVHLGLMVLYVAKHGGDPGTLACVGKSRAGTPPYDHIRTAVGPSGYDGQFYYAIAQAPWRTHTDELIDHAAARHARILYPAVCWLASRGDPECLLWVMPAVNLLVLAGLAALGGWYALRLGHSAWWGFALPLAVNAGLPSLHNLTDPLAALAVAGLLICWLTEGPAWLLGACAGLAVLGREQNLLIVAILGAACLSQRRFDRVLGLGIGCAVWAAWMAGLWWAYGVWPMLSSSGTFTYPGAGLLYRLEHPGGNDHFSSRLALFLMPALAHLLLQAGLGLYLAARFGRQGEGVLSLTVLAALGLILMAGTSIYCDFWSYTRIFFWLPLAIWMIGLRRGLTWPAWCLLPAALWPLAGALRYV
jgi:hypothetical protein